MKRIRAPRWGGFLILLAFMLTVGLSSAFADEACQSPFMPKIVGQEDYVYIITVGVPGIGDGFDKLVTIGVNPKMANYGKVVSVVSTGTRNEFHHGGLTDDRKYLWAGGLDTSRIYIFDLQSDPAHPKIAFTVDNYEKVTGGVVGPHTMYALPGRMVIANLSNSKSGGETALTEFTNEGKFIRTVWMPKEAPYGYDVRVNARLNRMLSSSFTGKENYMRDLKEVLNDEEAMKKTGHSVIVWDMHAMKPLQILEIPGMPLELRWANMPTHNYAFVHAATGNKIWWIHQDAKDGPFTAEPIIDFSEADHPEVTHVTGDISLSADDKYLFTAFLFEGKISGYDVSDPRHPKPLIVRKDMGKMVNMISQSWDGKRIYFTSSTLSMWDNKNEDGTYADEYFASYAWDGKELKEKFRIDFLKEKLGLPHLMNFGQEKFYRDVTASAAHTN